MNSVTLKIAPGEPLMVGGERVGSNYLSSLSYLSGRVVRGAFATWLSMNGKAHAIGELMQGLQIWNFFPATEYQDVQAVGVPPLSTLSCKSATGFSDEPHPYYRGHGAWDTLAPQLAYHVLQQRAAPVVLPFSLICDHCGANMESLRGFYACYHHSGTSTYISSRFHYHTQTRVGLSPSRRSATQGILYTATGLSPKAPSPEQPDVMKPLAFYGRVSGTSEQISELTTALNETSVGALRTRGYGQVQAQRVNLPPSRPLRDRVLAFNDYVTRCIQDLAPLAGSGRASTTTPEVTYFAITLSSSGVFTYVGLPILYPTVVIEDKALRPVLWATQPSTASGWAESWGLPKPTALAAQAGSWYVYAWEGRADEAFFTALEDLETHGVGLRRDEGFGECCVCHPLHLEEREL